MSRQVTPKKSLGQHFLTDQDVARRIAATLDAFAGLPVAEIGPGMGVLTQFLLPTHPDLKVVELDAESVAYLKAQMPQLPTANIIEADFLKLSDQDIFPGSDPFCIIGNYPYNISSQIFFKVLDWKERVTCCSGMLQKEVAERLAAPEGTRLRGILSVLLQAWYSVEYLFTVEPDVFNPPPKVQSGVVRLVRNDVKDLGCDPALFKDVVKTTFGQRRKTIRNSLRPLLGASPLPETPLLALRPEQLSVAQFVELTNMVAAK